MAIYTMKSIVEGKWKADMKERIHGAIKRGLMSGAIKVINEAIKLTDRAGEHPPVFDRGQYKGGWRHTETAEGVSIFNIAPHAPFIEVGVRPENVKIGRKMIRALALWVKRKGIAVAEPRSKGTVAKGKPKVTAEQAERVAWAIAKSMQKKGIFMQGGLIQGMTGLRILAKALLNTQKHLAAEVKREVAKEFQKASSKSGSK